MARNYETENRLQQKCHVWFWNTYPELRKLLFAVPNGGARSIREGKLFKETGTIAGVSDMILLYKARAYCFEMKTVVGTQKENQKDWQKKVEAQSIPYYIIRGLNEFQHYINLIIKQNEIKSREIPKKK